MVLTVYNSKPDIYGNRYWAYRLTDFGRTISRGKIDTNSIDREELRVKGSEYTHIELPIRDFNRFTKNFEYPGCHWEDIRKHIISTDH